MTPRPSTPIRAWEGGETVQVAVDVLGRPGTPAPSAWSVCLKRPTETSKDPRLQRTGGALADVGVVGC